jgi:hypothetical protein
LENCFAGRSAATLARTVKVSGKAPSGKGIRTIHPKGLAYVTVGGEVRWFPPDTEPETIRLLLARDPKCKVIPAEEKIRDVENWDKLKDER